MKRGNKMSTFYYLKNYTNHYENMEAEKKADEGKTLTELLREEAEEFAWLKEYLKNERK